MRRPPRSLAVLALCALLAFLPACESFYGHTDAEGNPVPEEVRQQDANERLAALQQSHDRLSSALEAILAERGALESRVVDLQLQLEELGAAGADTTGIERALAVAQEAIKAVGDHGGEVQDKLAEVDVALEGVQAEIDDGTLGGAAVSTKAAIDSAAAVAPAFGPYGQLASAGLAVLSGFLTWRGRQLKQERDRKAAANRGLVDSVEALLNSDMLKEKRYGAKRILAESQTPEARAEARRILAGGE